jgi:hypothetical protein
MKSRKSLWLAGATILAIALSSCNLGATAVPTKDPGVIQTQAFSAVLTQVSIQQTQTVLANPPTPLPTNTQLPTATLITASTFAPLNTPFAFNTQQPGVTPLASLVPTVGFVPTTTTKNGCNDGTFMGETAPLDGTVMDPLKNFSKGWQILNSGTCAWDEGYSFAFLGSPPSTPGFEGYSIVLPKNKPEDYTKPNSTQTYIVKLTTPKTPGDYKGYWKLKDDAGNFFGPLVSVWIVVK